MDFINILLNIHDDIYIIYRIIKHSYTIYIQIILTLIFIYKYTAHVSKLCSFSLPPHNQVLEHDDVG